MPDRWRSRRRSCSCRASSRSSVSPRCVSDASIARSVVRAIRSAVPGPAQPRTHRRGHAGVRERRVVALAPARARNRRRADHRGRRCSASSSAVSTASTASSRIARPCGSTGWRCSSRSLPARVRRSRSWCSPSAGRSVRSWAAKRARCGTSPGGQSLSRFIVAAMAPAVPMVAASPAAGVVVAGVRLRTVGAAVVGGHARAGSDVPSQHVVRRHLRSARRHRRAADLDAAVGDQRSSTAPRSPRSSKRCAPANLRCRSRPRSTTSRQPLMPVLWSRTTRPARHLVRASESGPEG